MMSANKDNKLDFLSVAKIGDKVWDARYGNGFIVNIQDPNKINNCLNADFGGKVVSFDRYGYALTHYVLPTLHLGHNLEVTGSLQSETGGWADATFPQSNSASIIAHLQAEVGEFTGFRATSFEPIKKDDKDYANIESPEEAADILLLLFHHAYKNGYNLLDEGRRKLEINKGRVWETELNEDGYFKHRGSQDD